MFSETIVTTFRRIGRSARRSIAAVVALGIVGGAAAFGAGAGTATAAPADDVSTVLGSLSNSSADLGLPDLPILRDLLRPPGGGIAGKTGCRRVIQIGDSTSMGADDAGRVPSPSDRLTAQYRQVGAASVVLDASPGRSIVEKANGQPNATEAVTGRLARGQRGCWVIAIGVNDAANVAVGNPVSADARIDRIMSQLRGQPVLWPTVATTPAATNRAYNPAAMSSFDAALRRASTRYPNLAVYDWAGVARPDWFVDGIHYTATGLAERNRRFAAALATAYPRPDDSTPAARWIAG
ncbi:hypothetical protein GCM10009624_32360 [Gordonia sinesedis]